MEYTYTKTAVIVANLFEDLRSRFMQHATAIIEVETNHRQEAIERIKNLLARVALQKTVEPEVVETAETILKEMVTKMRSAYVETLSENKNEIKQQERLRG